MTFGRKKEEEETSTSSCNHVHITSNASDSSPVCYDVIHRASPWIGQNGEFCVHLGKIGEESQQSVLLKAEFKKAKYK